ncbi:hypothetical protein CLG96_08605 [Sphingomonas oleivorans]|uniref:Uncharacterized protein n=1 Tax=Sphingomonas oleivorans TaxID=1735121 RepID=A0A2T5FYC8_9SPHN|nr:hypothetical protein [Sphingomonas oleivorans]PTQ11494.1 hypothetical protein CLG96_08605 [Sphingomonas oleivorans]
METRYQSRTDRRTANIKVETVRAPSGQEGLGNALRAAYSPRSTELPRDIRCLLDKLYQA